MSEFYSCDYLCSLKDINKQIPDIYISDGNRTAGKTTTFTRRLVDRFLKDGGMFYYLYRNKTDLGSCADTFFGDVGPKFYPGHEMTEKTLLKGNAVLLLLDDEPCGFCLALSMARKYKKNRGMFTSVVHGFFDEYQDEDGEYLNEEVNKMMSIHTTIAGGNADHSRRVPLYMASNTVSVLNPYYHAFGIDKRLRKNTRILRGNGWVYERTFNKSAAKAFESSAFNKAFSSSKYFQYAAQNVYLNDNSALIEKPTGGSQYMVSIKYKHEWYNIRKYIDCIYVSHGADHSYPIKICLLVEDMTDSSLTRLTTADFLLVSLRNYFNQGIVRFQDIECKNVFLDAVSYL